MAGQGSAAADIVGIFDANFTQVFEDARPINVRVIEDAKFMEHPVETGETIVDHKVLLPVEMEFSLILRAENFRDTYQLLKKAWQGSDVFTVQTRTDSYTNMAVVSIPHDETPMMADTVAVALKMREVKVVEAQFETLPTRSVENPADADARQRGEQPADPASPAQERKASVLYGILF